MTGTSKRWEAQEVKKSSRHQKTVGWIIRKHPLRFHQTVGLGEIGGCFLQPSGRVSWALAGNSGVCAQTI